MTCACEARSQTCACGCSATCPEAPRRLSSDPERYPVEPHIVSLVYALAATEGLQPCWSCEGHRSTGGALLRGPQVWFYANDALLPALVAQRVAELATKLTARWHVVLNPFSPEPTSPTYVLEAQVDETSHLEDAQRDAAVIADGFSDALRQLASRRLTSSAAQRRW
ncbi:MAG: hypothetical protein RIT81_37980 [Deltaproteobacteria bacterium]